jgi:RNA polymerase sigma-70 factor, ECF subfamily
MPSALNAPEPDEEDELVARCREGDAGAFRAIYNLHFSRVHQTARRLGTPPAELDDVTQEVFASAFGKLDRFEGGRFGHWLHRICANVVTDHHRKRNVRDAFRRVFGAHAEPDTSPSPEGVAERAQASTQVAAILARMRPKHREVFALFELEGLSGEEIAARVGCPVNTVWTRLHHARQAFVKIGRKRGYIEEAL